MFIPIMVQIGKGIGLVVVFALGLGLMFPAIAVHFVTLAF